MLPKPYGKYDYVTIHIHEAISLLFMDLIFYSILQERSLMNIMEFRWVLVIKFWSGYAQIDKSYFDNRFWYH